MMFLTKNILRLGAGLLCVVSLAACNTVPVEEQSEELRLLLGEIRAREQVLDKRQGLLSKRAELLATIEIQQENAMPLDERAVGFADHGDYLFPPVAADGQCYRLANLPPQLSAEPLEVVVQDAADQIVLSPAVFETVPRKIVVDYRLGEAEGEVQMVTREEQIVVKPSHIDFEAEPAVFDTRPEDILAVAAHTRFTPCEGSVSPVEDLAQANAKWCAEAVPAQYQTVEHREVLSLSRVQEVTRPSETISIKIREPADPVDTALYEPIAKVIEHQQLVSPASFKREVLLPEFQTVTVKRLLRPAALRWVPVVCGEKQEAELLVKLQELLASQGYQIGEADGEWGDNTDAALTQFRTEHDLPQLGRDLSLEELEILELAGQL